MSPSIRPYETRDLAACRDLWLALTQRHRDIYDSPTIGGDDPGLHFDEHLARQDLAGLWVAELKSVVVGFTGLLREGDEAEVEPIVVREDARSRGIGRALLRHAEAEAKRLGATSLNIRPVARNVEAIRLFVAEGFDVLGHVQLFKKLGPSRTAWREGASLHGLDLRY